jgi:hypothetical protein
MADPMFNNGIMCALTEMALQGYDTEQIADIMRPMGFTADEIHQMLEYVDPDWEKNEVDYLVAVYLAWASLEEDE